MNKEARPAQETPAAEMSTYRLAELLRRWARGQLTGEQAIGHLIQQVVAIGQRLDGIEQRLRQLEGSGPEAGNPHG